MQCSIESVKRDRDMHLCIIIVSVKGLWFVAHLVSLCDNQSLPCKTDLSMKLTQSSVIVLYAHITCTFWAVCVD